MDLKEFNSALPKPWLNPQVNSIVKNIDASAVSPPTLSVFPATVTPAQLSGQTIAFGSAPAFAVTLPSAAALTAYFTPLLGPNPPANYSITVNATVSGGGVGTFTPGAGLGLWTLQANFTMNAGVSRVWTFSNVGGVWTMFY